VKGRSSGLLIGFEWWEGEREVVEEASDILVALTLARNAESFGAEGWKSCGICD
jgi:hypothetical protein